MGGFAQAGLHWAARGSPERSFLNVPGGSRNMKVVVF